MPAQVGVIGAGIIGLSTAYALTRRGVTVSVYDGGVPGAGQSGGQSRVFRHAHADPRLARLARSNAEIWRKWEHDLGTDLLSGDGSVVIGAAGEQRFSVLEAIGGIPARMIDGAELHRRLPLVAGYSGPILLDEAGGALYAAKAIAALLAEVGDALVPDHILSVHPSARGVEVRTGGSRAHHDSVVVCAGQGTAQLARAIGLSLPVKLEAHTRVTFAVRGDPPAQLACFQDPGGAFGEPGTYAAAVPGRHRYALGIGDNVGAREDGSLVDPAGLGTLAERARAYVGRAMPGLDADPVGYRHCYVTQLPWGPDGLGVWEVGDVYFVAGSNLFKHAPLVGRRLADAAAGDGLADDLQPAAKLGQAPGIPESSTASG